MISLLCVEVDPLTQMEGESKTLLQDPTGQGKTICRLLVLESHTCATRSGVHPHNLAVPENVEATIGCLLHREFDRWFHNSERWIVGPLGGRLYAGFLFQVFGFHEDLVGGCIDTGMDTTFCGFLQRRLNDTTNKTRNYFEISELFPREQINALFKKEISSLLQTTTDEAAREELSSLLAFDWVGYSDRALRRAGFGDADLDQLVQDLAVKMLVTGNLFSGWRGGSLKARFLVALRNAIATLVVKQKRLRRRSNELPQDAVASTLRDESLISDFRNYLQTELGPVATAVFDQRLAGQDVKDLIGQQGIETSYRLKKIVAEIKDAAKRFAAGKPKQPHREQRTKFRR